MTIVSAHGIEYYMDEYLKRIWDGIRDSQLVKRDEDRVYIVDGREGSGKSLFAIQQAAYIDPTLDLTRICFTADEFLKAIRSAVKGQVIIFDEAFRGLSVRSSLSKINKQIVQALQEMRQLNLIIFIVSPSIFLLDIYPAMIRSEALFHIYKDRAGNRGFFRAYNYQKKGFLYQRGLKKGWSYEIPHTEFIGRFYGKYPGGKEFEMAYRKKKEDAFRFDSSSEKEEKDVFQEKYYKLLRIFVEKMQISNRAAAELLEQAGLPISHQRISQILTENTVSG